MSEVDLVLIIHNLGAEVRKTAVPRSMADVILKKLIVKPNESVLIAELPEGVSYIPWQVIS